MVNKEQLRAAMATLSNGRFQGANTIASVMADPMSHFFLHPSESPGLALVFAPFMRVITISGLNP